MDDRFYISALVVLGIGLGFLLAMGVVYILEAKKESKDKR